MFVQPKISEQQAKNIFASRKSILSLASKIRKKKGETFPKRVEVIYLPFFLFDVSVKRENKIQKDGPPSTQKVRLSVDGLLGHSVMYAEEGLDLKASRVFPVLPFVISQSEAEETALNEYKAILLEHGLRTRSFPHADKILGSQKIYYPFWIGYFKKGKGYDFKALDAVSGEIQGIKMKKVFLQAFHNLAEK
jgi:hypothetical protein